MKQTGKNGVLDVTKPFGDFRALGIDFDTVLSSQLKNLDALTQVNQLAVEGMQTIARHQLKIMQQASEHASALLRDWAHPVALDDRLAKNVEVAKQAFETGIASTRDLAELATSANTAVINVINTRINESLDELRDYAKKRVINH
jgi:phasin family protein